MKDSNYIVVMGWMMSALGLSGNDLLAYALIYSHSQDGEGAYWGSLSHTADRLNISRRAAVDILNRLVERGHIKKSEANIDGIQRCMYRAVMPDEAIPPTRKQEVSPLQPKKVARFTPPTVEEVQEYCRERGNKVDAQRFVDFYTANGWHQGRGKPIKDWRAAVRTWEREEHYNHNYGQRINKESVQSQRRETIAREVADLDAKYYAARAAEECSKCISGAS